ncbi:MAG: DUF1727 domain-containing protein, partial [Candidatus Levyibacteriota bacterium]
PAFGRQEKILINGKTIEIFLAKNPTSFNQSLETIAALKAKHVLFALNDRIPDGRDVSWIWDIDFEEYRNTFSSITVSGERVFDLALRLQYADIRMTNIEFRLGLAIQKALDTIPQGQTLFILPTYSAMLDVRKIVTGKKIL